MSESESLMRRLNAARNITERTASSPITEMTDDVGELLAYGWLRGVRDRATMLELRHYNGSYRSLAYAWLADVIFDPSEGIELDFGTAKVKLKGRNLRPLHLMIQRHRAIWVQELDPKRANAEEGDTIVTGIVVLTGPLKGE